MDESNSIIDIVRGKINQAIKKFAETRGANHKFMQIMKFAQEQSLFRINRQVDALTEKNSSSILKFLEARNKMDFASYDFR